MQVLSGPKRPLFLHVGPKRPLFLHIGTHKTGSTSFQRAMMQGRDRFAAAGLRFLNLNGQPTGNSFDLAQAVLRPGLMTGARMRGTHGPTSPAAVWRMARRLRQAAQGSAAPALMLSAEALCFARTRAEAWRLRAICAAAGLRPVPILCLRADADWRASWAAQLDRETRAGGFRHPHGQGLNDIRGDWYHDRAALIAFWRGIGDLRLVDYDRERDTDGSIIPALLAATGLPDLPDLGQSGLFLNPRR